MITPKNTKLAKTFKHKSPLLGGRIDPLGQFIFVGAQDNSVQRFDIESGKATPYLGHKSWVRAIAFHEPTKTVLSADYHGRILLWPVEGDKPEPTLTLDAHKGFARALAVSPDQKMLASCGNDNMVRLWSLPDGKLLRELSGHERHVYNVAFHPEGKSLASFDLMGKLRHWNLETGNCERELEAKELHKFDPTFRADIGGARSMILTPDGKSLLCAGITNVSNAFAGVGNPLIVLFDWESGKKRLLKPAKTFRGCAWGVDCHEEGFYVGVGGGGGGGMLWFWKADQDKSMFDLKLPTNARDLDIHPDGKRLLIPFADGSVRIYELK